METKSKVAVHLFVVCSVGSGRDPIYPFLISQIPMDCFIEAFYKLKGGFPAEFLLEFCGVDSVTKVMPGAVGNVSDQVLVGSGLKTKNTIDGRDQQTYEIDVSPFIKATYVISFANSALVKNEINGADMIFDIKPVTHVFAFSIDGKWLLMTNVIDKERNEFFWELIGAVIVGAVCYQSRHAVGIMIGTYEVIGRSFGGGIGAVWEVAGGLSEEAAVKLKRTIDFVRRDVIEKLIFPVASPGVFGRLQQAECAEDVGASKGKWVFDGSVDVAFGCQMYDAIHIVFRHQFVHKIEVANIGTDEYVVGSVFQIFQVGKVARIGQFIYIDDAVLRILVYEEADGVAADEPGASCDNNVTREAGHENLIKNGVGINYRFMFFRHSRRASVQ